MNVENLVYLDQLVHLVQWVKEQDQVQLDQKDHLDKEVLQDSKVKGELLEKGDHLVSLDLEEAVVKEVLVDHLALLVLLVNKD